jgi:hypothetical protein
VLIDGTPFAEKTPIKTTLKVGPHSIVVRKDGLDVWRQNVNAEASSEYEYNPSFERVPAVAPRPATPAPKPAAPKPEPASPPTGSADVKPATESVTKSLIPAVVSGQPKAEPVGSAAVGTDGEALAKPAP